MSIKKLKGFKNYNITEGRKFHNDALTTMQMVALELLFVGFDLHTCHSSRLK